MEVKNLCIFKKIHHNLKLCSKAIESIFKQSPKQNTIFLPESIRYQLQYSKWYIWSKDLMSLLSEKFDSIPIFLTAKYCDNESKKSLLESILNSKKDYISICSQYISINSEHTIDAHKLQYLSMIGFETTSSFDKKIAEVDPNNNHIPVILLHWWLLWIKAIKEKYNSWIFRDDTKSSWRSRNSNNILTPINQFGQWEKYMIVDDTIQTWDTLKLIQKIITDVWSSSISCIPFTIPTTH